MNFSRCLHGSSQKQPNFTLKIYTATPQINIVLHSLSELLLSLSTWFPYGSSFCFIFPIPHLENNPNFSSSQIMIFCLCLTFVIQLHHNAFIQVCFDHIFFFLSFLPPFSFLFLFPFLFFVSGCSEFLVFVFPLFAPACVSISIPLPLLSLLSLPKVVFLQASTPHSILFTPLSISSEAQFSQFSPSV